MDGLTAGTLVHHRTLGPGKVIAVEASALHVFFPGSDTRFAAKLRWPAAGAFLSRDGSEVDPWLQGLTSFALDPESGRYALSANFISQDEAISTYLSENPGAFGSGVKTGRGEPRADRGTRWRSAVAGWESLLGEGKAAKLHADAEYGQLVKRLLQVAERAAGIPGMPDAADLEEAFESGDEVRHYLGALVGFLSVPSPARARFDKLAAAANGLGAPPEAAWPLVTFFPFVAAPARHVVLLPRSTCPGASRLGCDLQYQAAPSFATYGRLRDLTARLLGQLAPAGARDHVDVECFLHATGARRSPASKRARPATPARVEKPSRTAARRKK